ncbi:putative GMC oxidoreductase [Annulohypoxylon truncatum]|uniref:putative GMC oxidoreductase n=1 Tax=Annulohypoxylon truncatum TaxID=327061 RepID=UPI0020078CA9|nr:putative GMC oxidoreductase [Annulohypoxylon truncatum]KAI1213545.1 putative GMC oxidoreductase [Annulohypoxylon truncatum]
MKMSSFDFVIIGGGTSGLVLANRLSEDPGQHVLVLEAGSDHYDDPRVNTPALFLTLLKSEADWAFETTPQTADWCLRRISRADLLVCSKDGRYEDPVFVPPSKSLIDSWGSLGNEGWNWNVLGRYFAKVYSSAQPSFAGGSPHPIRRAWAEAFEANGYLMTSNPLLNPTVGSFDLLSSIHPEKKERSYAVSAYYHPIKHRENLKVLTDAVVEKILFDDSRPPKVILAAGVFQSPKLLELSGIGDAKLLQRQGIQVIQDLPQVGENLHDHLVCYISYETLDDISTLDSLIRQEPEAIQQAMEEYATKKSGMLSSVGVYICVFLPLVNYLSGDSHDQLKEMLRQNRPTADDQRAKIYHDVAEKAILDSKQPSAAHFTAIAQQILPVDPNSSSPAGPVPGNFISFGVMLSHPLSRGSVHISSNNVSEPPIIDPKYLSNSVDIEVYARHLQYAETIASSPAFNKILKHPLRRRDPASDPTDLEQAKNYIRTSAISQWHPGGTCPMLPLEKGGVVDTHLRVYGTRNLRVVDASSIPLISTANLQATVYAFAERAADLIKEDHGLRS